MNRLIILLLASLVCLDTTTRAKEFSPLSYNHPGLAVDLGVGLWAWPIPCDADGDGDFDLIVSCPDKPSNGVWFFENQNGDTAKDKFPVFEPAKQISKTVNYLMPSYVEGKMRVLSPGAEYLNFTTKGIEDKLKLSIDVKFHKPLGKQPKGPKMRHNQWRYVDFEGDGATDLSVGVEDWSYYGWDDAWDAKRAWQNGPLHGWIYIFRNSGTNEQPKYDEPYFLEAAGERLDLSGCPSQNFADFDDDGDLDLICGEFLDKFTYFENPGKRKEPKYGSGRRLVNDKQETLAMDLEMIVPIAFDWDKDGDIDLVSGNTAGYIEFFENLSGSKVAEPRWDRPVRLNGGSKVFRIMAGENGSI